MRIGIDAHILGKNKGGVERYVERLVRLLPEAAPEHEYVVFTSRSFRDDVSGERVRQVRMPCSDPIVQRSLLLPWLARAHRLDALHVQRVSPPCPGCPVVVSVHDILPLTDPEDHPGFRNNLVRRLTGPSVASAAAVVTVSESARRRIVEHFALPPARVAAVYNGLDHGRFAPAGGEDDGSILYVGALEPRKNLEVALAAFKSFLDRVPGADRHVRLVVAGGERVKGYRRALEKLASSLGVSHRVHFAGFVSDDAYRSLLGRARVFLAPSRGEGFDLPPLEAMASGVPVVCSDIDVHGELLAGGAFFFRADSAEDLASAMARVWTDDPVRAGLRDAGARIASRFTWERTALGMAEVYGSIKPNGQGGVT